MYLKTNHNSIILCGCNALLMKFIKPLIMKNLIKQSIKILPVLLISVIIITLIRTFVLFNKPNDIVPCVSDGQDHHEILNKSLLIDNFIDAIKFKTVTKGAQNYDKNELKRLTNYLISSKNGVNKYINNFNVVQRISFDP